MAAKPITITDFKTELPGKESADGLLYEFPVVKSTNKLGKGQMWQIVVRLLSASVEKDGNPLKFIQIIIMGDFL